MKTRIRCVTKIDGTQKFYPEEKGIFFWDKDERYCYDTIEKAQERIDWLINYYQSRTIHEVTYVNHTPDLGRVKVVHFKNGKCKYFAQMKTWYGWSNSSERVYEGIHLKYAFDYGLDNIEEVQEYLTQKLGKKVQYTSIINTHT